jgi:ABC-2 type transport system permease protein
MSTITRYIGIYAALWRNSVMREMIFRMNFLLWIVVDLLWFGLQLCFISVIYLHTDSIGSWSKWQVVLLIAASNFIQQVFHGFFLVNLTGLSDLVRTGKLDFLLVQPVNTRFIVSLRQIDLGAFVNALVAVSVMTYAGFKLGIRPGVGEVSLFLLLCGVGVMVHYSLMLLLAAVSFWTVKAQGIVWGYYNLFNIARMPDEAFRGLFKAFFTLAIPMLLVSNVPARVLAGKLASPGLILLLLGMGAGCLIVSELGWRASLKRYTSASS